MILGSILGVLFDFGMVFTHEPQEAVFNEISHLTQLDLQQLKQKYFDERLPYDQGIISDESYWKKISPTITNIQQLVELDFDLWSHLNSDTISAWKTLSKDFKLGILSNMPHTLSRKFAQHCDFLKLSTDVYFSCDFMLAKPDPEFYKAILKQWKIAPDNTLFIDDKIENITAAQNLGFKTLHYKHSINILEYIYE